MFPGCAVYQVHFHAAWYNAPLDTERFMYVSGRNSSWTPQVRSALGVELR
jgi:hypothetical protein